MIPDGYNNTLWFNYETITRKNNGNLTRYIFGNGKHGYAEGIFSKLYNAVWNDYAEFRKADIIKPGSVIKENGDGSMSIVEKRLEPSARIISDTYGVAIGENQENNAPIAVAGRVLVYPYQDRNNYKPGMSVCAAPGGTVDIMSREEIREYPDCIIGIVSEIPNYNIWYAGNYKMKKNSEEKKIIENPIPI
ncbi:MAG: hypothetical protein J6I85_05485 [Clostridia bacterium]|nr:hypothetical protein [Clostridia bacterium]